MTRSCFSARTCSAHGHHQCLPSLRALCRPSQLSGRQGHKQAPSRRRDSQHEKCSSRCVMESRIHALALAHQGPLEPPTMALNDEPAFTSSLLRAPGEGGGELLQGDRGPAAADSAQGSRIVSCRGMFGRRKCARTGRHGVLQLQLLFAQSSMCHSPSRQCSRQGALTLSGPHVRGAARVRPCPGSLPAAPRPP